ncbi:MAG: DUF58 domain-containing protein [Planctomycetota bacterium]
MIPAGAPDSRGSPAGGSPDDTVAQAAADRAARAETARAESVPGAPPAAARRSGWRPSHRGNALTRLRRGLFDLPGQIALRITRAGWLFLLLTAVLAGMHLFLLSRGAQPAVSNWPMLLMYLMAGLALADWAIGWLAMRRCRIARTLPPRVFAGDSCFVRLELLTPPGPFPPAAVRLDDTVQHRLGLWNVFFTAPTAGRAAHAAYHFRPLKRGVYSFGPVLAHSDYPLGLFRHFHRIDAPDQLLVYPALGVIHAWPFAAGDRRWLGEWEKVFTRAPEDFRSLRDYHPGDPLRTIHWRTTARMETLMVKEYEHHSRPPLTVVLDTHTGLMTANARHLETALSYIATLAVECQRRQRLFHFCAFAPEPVAITVHAASGALAACLDELAWLLPNNQRTLSELTQFIPSPMLSNGDVLLLTLNSAKKGFDRSLFQGRHAALQEIALADDEFKTYFTRGHAGMPDDEILLREVS